MARFGVVIAERRLVLRDDPRRVITVSIGSPRRHRGDDDEWECPFRITGAGVRRLEYGRGLDAMQALITALAGIRHVLDETGLPAVWPNEDAPDTGFPRSIPIMLGALTTRLERLVDRELEKDLERLQAKHARRKTARKPPPRKRG
jgi:hypothetical protein